MEFLYELSKKFRQAIDVAKLNRQFTVRSCLFTFPNECCDITCDLLGEYLFENGIDTYQINAQSKYDYQRRHVWLVTKNEGIVIDITGDQFVGEKNFPNNIESVYVGEENELQKVSHLIEKLNPTLFLLTRHFTMGLGEHQIFVSKD